MSIHPDNNLLPPGSSIAAKHNRGEKLTEEEQRQLEGYYALKKVKNRFHNRGAYVEFRTDKGIIEGSIVGNDEEGNYLVEYATNSQCIIWANTIVRSYLKRESTLAELDEYVIGSGLYERIVDTNGYIIRFLDPRLESRRVKKEELTLPDSEITYVGSDWGMKYKED